MLILKKELEKFTSANLAVLVLNIGCWIVEVVQVQITMNEDWSISCNNGQFNYKAKHDSVTRNNVAELSVP